VGARIPFSVGLFESRKNQAQLTTAFPMPQSNSTRFDYAQPSAQVTRAIVIRGKGRFAIVRPDRSPPAIISRKAAENLGEAKVYRMGGIPPNSNATEEFEAGMQFRQDRVA
jgi:hypothetical protein